MFAEPLSIVEDTGIWPAALARGFISLIPEGEGCSPCNGAPSQSSPKCTGYGQAFLQHNQRRLAFLSNPGIYLFGLIEP